MKQFPSIRWRAETLCTPKTFIFDWEGTLASSQAFLVACYEKTFSAFGKPLPPVEVLLSYASLDVFREHLREDVGKAQHLFQDFLKTEDCTTLSVYDGVSELLSFLNEQGYPLFIISNGNGRNLNKLAHDLGWSSFFKKIVGANDFLVRKPDPEIVFQTLAFEGICPDQTTWFVGDSAIDLACARGAGCTAVNVLNYKKSCEQDVQSYDLVLQKTPDLKKILTELQ